MNGKSFIFDNENPELKLSELPENRLGGYLDAHELDMLFTHSKIARFSEKDMILKQGEKSDGIYLIIEGEVSVIARIMGQGTTNIETLTPGHFFGEISFIEKGPNTTSFVAKTTVQCLIITSTYFELLSVYFPRTKYKILKVISEQICGRLKRMHDKTVTFITNSDMTIVSFFSWIAHSLTSPKQINFDEAGIVLEKLQKKSPFNLFNRDEFDVLINHGVLLKAPKNCKLIYEGDNSSLYIVIHGAVQSSITQDSKSAKLSVIGPGTLFSSMSCIERDSSFTITFITCEQAVLFKISNKELDYLQSNHPELWYKLFNLICGSLVALGKSINKLDIRLNIETYNR
ncbi:MAG: cyclic nucleotide-binding domain-containing protein [Legionella sp.]|nr:cyclic nucleotide-binding domain-containing protein [Legionella sp.]